MRQFTPLLRLPAALLAALLIAACNPASAPTAAPSSWQLDITASQVQIFAIKAEQIGESFSLALGNGTVDQDGNIELSIDLASIDTGIPIRNERMRKFLLKTEDWPMATVSANIDLQQFEGLMIGQMLSANAPVELALHGLKVSYEVNFLITRLSTKRVMVQSATPISVVADDLNFGAGLAKLQELAGLPSITPVSAIGFLLIFEGESEP
ncbi:MAG: hypothetical protein COA47_02515 [Robiginitomaculum sp.]|nr:MAG: hypothetical protein COA47_02515 [Robiginitomaculum sp.]